jgi:beta-N-acetylhexosaminidase
VRSLVAALQREARLAGVPALLVATDQEGGQVRRLPWAGPSRSAVELGRLSPAEVRREARQAGRSLRAAGINVDLAPVADVPTRGSFMAAEQRTFGAGGVTAAAATAFANGLADAKVAAVLKHFPGIGRATRNTDRTAVELDASRVMLEGDLTPFRAAVRAGAPMVMLSNATYPAIESKPAAWSPRVLGLLRNDLRFRGVTITDALDGAAATRRRTLASAAVLSAQAGVDLLLFTGSEASSSVAFEHVVAVAERGGIGRAALLRSYGRIMELKRIYG